MINLTFPHVARYTDPIITVDIKKMRNVTFYSAFTLILFMALGLGYMVFSTALSHPELGNMILISSLATLGCYLLVGFGLAIPVLLLASVLGWLQLVLLLAGNIDPHLSREGFFNVLNTLFEKL